MSELELLELPWRGPLASQGLPDNVRRYCEVYQAEVEDGHLTVVVGKGPQGWHLSISHRLNIAHPVTGLPLPGRVPTYEELKTARYKFCPDEVCMAQLFPRAEDFVNMHPTTLQLFEVPAEIAK